MAGLREKQSLAFMFCAEWQKWEQTGARLGRPPPRRACTVPSQALMADYGNEQDHPEDNTSFNPEAELNNTDATCAFKCLFEGLIVVSQGFQLSKVFFLIDRSGHMLYDMEIDPVKAHGFQGI